MRIGSGQVDSEPLKPKPLDFADADEWSGDRAGNARAPADCLGEGSVQCWATSG